MNAIKSILLATLLALPLPLAAQAPTTDSFMSGARLKELCFADTTDNPVSSTFVCVGYIMGVVDTLASLKAWDQAGIASFHRRLSLDRLRSRNAPARRRRHP